MRLKAIRVRTDYWRPGADPIEEIVEAVRGVVHDGDIVTVSEKAISTASGLLIDESKIKAGRVARLLSSLWMRRVWGGPLGRLTRLRERTLQRLRRYPVEGGAAHKQVALRTVGLLQALRHYSEGGIDASNLPYSLVSLPLRRPMEMAEGIRRALEAITGSSLSVMIIDGDTTYSWRNLHLAPRRVETPGLIHVGGFLTFLVGRALGFRGRATPIAISGERLNPDLALELADAAHRIRGHGAGRTVWDMCERFGVGPSEVTWKMLERVEHSPIVILRRAEHRWPSKGAQGASKGELSKQNNSHLRGHPT